MRRRTRIAIPLLAGLLFIFTYSAVAGWHMYNKEKATTKENKNEKKTTQIISPTVIQETPSETAVSPIPTSIPNKQNNVQQGTSQSRIHIETNINGKKEVIDIATTSGNLNYQHNVIITQGASQTNGDIQKQLQDLFKQLNLKID